MAAAVQKFNTSRPIPFSKPNQPINDTCREIICLFEDPAHGEWLCLHFKVQCEMRWGKGYKTVGKLIRNLLWPDAIIRVFWSSDACNVSELIVLEVLQALIDTTINAMLNAAHLGENRPTQQFIIHKCECIFDNMRIAETEKDRKAKKAAAKDYTSVADATSDLVTVLDDQANILSKAEYISEPELGIPYSPPFWFNSYWNLKQPLVHAVSVKTIKMTIELQFCNPH